MTEKTNVEIKRKEMCKTISESLIEAQANIKNVYSDSWFESGLTKFAAEAIIKNCKDALLKSGLMISRKDYEIIDKKTSDSCDKWFDIKFSLEKVSTGNAIEFSIELPFPYNDKKDLPIYLDRGLAILLRGLLLPAIEQVPS